MGSRSSDAHLNSGSFLSRHHRVAWRGQMIRYQNARGYTAPALDDYLKTKSMGPGERLVKQQSF